MIYSMVRNKSKRIKNYKFGRGILIIIGIILISGFIFARAILPNMKPNLGFKADDVNITVGKIPASGNSALYRLPNNELLLRLFDDDTPHVDIYIINLEKGVVISPRRSGLIFFWKFLYCKDGIPPGVQLDGSAAKANFFNADLMMDEGHFSFDRNGHRDKVSVNYYKRSER